MKTIDNKKATDIDLIRFLDALSTWFGGMSQFMAATKSEWQHVPTGYHIMAQRLRKHTLDLERDAKALSIKLKIQETGNRKWAAIMTSTSALLTLVAGRQSAFAAARAQDADHLAPEFNLFHFIKADELKLSNIIAWLLKPSGSHGQGYRFLHQFDKTFDFNWNESVCAGATVRTEVSTSRLDAARRIDILIQSGSHAIAIENKPSAADQANQVHDYLIHLDQEFKGSRCLMYLSANGSPPSDSSVSVSERDSRIQKNELAIMGYGHLLPWLKACREVCRADRVSFFLDEFYRYIQQHFLGIRDMKERDQIVAEMTSSPESVSAALQVIKAAEQMKNVLIKKLEAQLQIETSSRGWQLKQKTASGRPHTSGARGTGFLVQFSPTDQIAFAIGFGNDQRSFFAYGINTIGANPPLSDRIYEVMKTAFGAGEKWTVWPWGKQTSTTDQCLPIDGDWSSSDKPWLGIADGTLATTIINAAEEVRKVLVANGLIVDQPKPTGVIS